MSHVLFSHSCVDFGPLWMSFFSWFYFVGSAFTRTCPAVLACPRYPLNALYEKAVSVYVLVVTLLLWCDCVRDWEGRAIRLVRSLCLPFVLLLLCCLSVATGIYEGIYVGRAIQKGKAIELVDRWVPGGGAEGFSEMLWDRMNVMEWDGSGCWQVRKRESIVYLMY